MSRIHAIRSLCAYSAQWFKTDLVLPEGSVVLQEKSQEKKPPIVNAVKIRPDFIEKNKPENLVKEIEDYYSLISVDFTNLREWILLHRAIIHQMGYTYFSNSGGWSDPRLDELTKSLRQDFGINRFLSVDDERNIKLLDIMKQEQKIILKRRKMAKKGFKKA